jgi:hypothetical protein
MTTGPGRPDTATSTACATISGMRWRVVDLGDPFRQRREHLAVVDFLERVAPGVLVRDLANEQQHRRAVLHGDVHADRAVAGARPACDHRGGGPAFQFAIGLGHVDRAGLEPAGDQFQFVADFVQPIERVEKTLAWHLEHVVDALRDQRGCEDMPAEPGFHRKPSVAGKNRFGGRGTPRFSRNVLPSYSLRNTPRRCSSGTT